MYFSDDLGQVMVVPKEGGATETILPVGLPAGFVDKVLVDDDGLYVVTEHTTASSFA